MPCFYPLPATPMPSGKPLVHSPLNYTLKAGDIKLPCGRCIGCKATRGQEWATRCFHESKAYLDNAFLTLTYDPNYRPRPDLPTAKPVDNREDARELPTIAPEGLEGPNIARVDNSRLRPRGGWGIGLSKDDHQRFLKRYRDKCGPLRYYMCGEYGQKLENPHYHYLIFGHNFRDRYYWTTSKSGEKLYRSATLDQLWPFGHAWIGDVTYESCSYVAAYVMKKMTGPKAEEHYLKTDEAGTNYWIMPEFNEMSRRPGIAKEWWDANKADVMVGDFIITSSGQKMRPPRYYDKLLKQFDPIISEVTKLTRETRTKEKDEDNTPQRLADKEKVALAKLALKHRNLEPM